MYTYTYQVHSSEHRIRPVHFRLEKVLIVDTILQTTLDNLVYTSAARLAPLYLIGWIYCLVPKLATKTTNPMF